MKASGIPEAFIFEGTWDDTKENFIAVHSSNVGRPEFSAELENDACVSQSISVSVEDYKDCLSSFKGLGFSYNARLKRWSKPGEAYVWRIEEDNVNNYVLMARRLHGKRVI